MTKIIIEKNVMVPMGDGVKLATDIYRLDSAPRFDRNSNTGGIISEESRDLYQPAINRIFHDAAHPSNLVLPLISQD